MPKSMPNNFFDKARSYWKFAPSGKGKVDTTSLLAMDAATFVSEHDAHRTSRLDHYWEDRYVVRYLEGMFAGKRILSFGSGLGHNEIQFLMGGARVVCADIVQSNLDVIARACELKGLHGATFLYMEDSAHQQFDGPFDHIFVRGSLMTMPAAMQRSALANMRQALAPNGYIILNLYTRAFLDATTSVDDPELFARASDPSVGSVHNPWSDWHDDAKLLDLAGSDMVITHRQFWNQGWYVWYFLTRASECPAGTSPAPICDALAAAAAENKVRHLVLRDDLELLAADNPPGKSNLIVTDSNKYGYAAGSRQTWSRSSAGAIDGLVVDADIEDGAFSVGILDLDRDYFVFARAVWEPGRHTHYFAIPGASLPENFRLVLSNHRTDQAASSRFHLYSIGLTART